MARRVIRRRRPPAGRVVRRVRPTAAAAPQSVARVQPEGSKVLMATSNGVRNLILPKLASIDDVQLAGLADSPETALKLLVQEHPEVVIFDMDFGGKFVGLDTARIMQKTRVRAAIVMLVPDLNPEEMRSESRRFGSSWSYVKKNIAARVDVLESVLKSAMRGVQWIEPELSRPLNTLWKVAEEARDMESARAEAAPPVVTSRTKLKNAKFSEPESEPIERTPYDPKDDVDELDEIAPGIKTKSTGEADIDDLNITSVSVGHGGIGQNVGRVRRAG